MRFKSDSDLTADVTPQQAWALPEVRATTLTPNPYPYPCPYPYPYPYPYP